MTTEDDGIALPIDPDAESFEGRQHRVSAATLAVIAIGGMIGATARYGIARWLSVESGRFPWATFWTNLSGSFVLGFVLVVLVERFPAARLVRVFVATGIIGAFTTMSTFAVETALLVDDGKASTAAVYVTASVIGGITLAVAGIALARASVTR
jgi:CrcB protein